ncbi:MAG: CYTH domain-containing protein [Planctomycetota bacterium]|jgi:uncharacterized protein YjbK
MSSPELKESEIKVQVTEEEAGRLRGRLGDPVQTLKQLSYFYESPQDHLAKATASLRVREESDLSRGDTQILVTVKGSSQRAGALMVRPEVESQLEQGTWDELRSGKARFASLDLPPIEKLREMVADLDEIELSLLGSIENRREVFKLEADDISLDLLLDSTKYPDGTIDFEIEAEIPQAMAGRGARALRLLFDELGMEWRPSEVGKYLRFRRKIGRDPREDRTQA